MHQLAIAQQRVLAGLAQAEGKGNERVAAAVGQPAQMTQQNGVIDRSQAGVVHRPRKAHGLGRQAVVIHRLQAFGIDGHARVFGTAGRGRKQGFDQPARVVVAGGALDIRVVQAGGDLNHHLAYVVDLNRALGENAPDLGHQAVENALVAHMLELIVIQRLHRPAEVIRAFAVGLAERAGQQVEVERHHLGEEVAGAFRGHAGVAVIASGHRQQAQFAQGLHGREHGIPLAQRTHRQRRLENGRSTPVAMGEDAGTFIGRHALVEGLRAAVAGKNRRGVFQYFGIDRLAAVLAGFAELGQLGIEGSGQGREIVLIVRHGHGSRMSGGKA